MDAVERRYIRAVFLCGVTVFEAFCSVLGLACRIGVEIERDRGSRLPVIEHGRTFIEFVFELDELVRAQLQFAGIRFKGGLLRRHRASGSGWRWGRLREFGQS